MPNKFVRIKNPDTGHEETVTESFAKAYDLPVIDKDAVDPNGRPLVSKPKVNLPTAETKSTTTDDSKTSATTTKSGGAAR